MRATLFVLVLGAVAAAVDQSEFNSWAAAHGKTYDERAEYDRALAAWAENAAVVDQLNAEDGDGAVYALNRFADLTAEQFADGHLASLGPAPRAVLDAKRGSGAAVAGGGLPESYDWRDVGAVTEVKGKRCE